MYGNYNLYAYDDKSNCIQEWFFENVMITSENNTISVISNQGKLLYMISTNCCTVVVMEDEEEK